VLPLTCLCDRHKWEAIQCNRINEGNQSLYVLLLTALLDRHNPTDFAMTVKRLTLLLDYHVALLLFVRDDETRD